MLFYILFNNLYSSPEEAVISFVITMLVFMFALSIHEFSQGLAAYQMGDITPKAQGRLTLNPFKHVNGAGFLAFALLGVGWANPMAINPTNFKNYRKGIRWVSFAGVLGLLICGLLCAGVYGLLMRFVGVPNVFMQYVYVTLQTCMVVNSCLIMFNLLPIFPLDMFTFISTYMKGSNKFLQFSIRNRFNILITILLVALLVEVLFGFQILSWYLTSLESYVFWPIASLLGFGVVL